MRSVRRANTAPEMEVRRALHAMGLRFRLHRKDLPGTPDIVLPRYRTAIFVNGCFWHRHEDCSKSTNPRTRAEFWAKKFSENAARDLRKSYALSSLGWSVITIWQCETERREDLRRILESRVHPSEEAPLAVIVSLI